MNNYPIKATLITRDGFEKQIEVYALQPTLRYPKMAKFNATTMSISSMPNFKEPEVIEFYLYDYAVFKKLEIIEAIYHEI